VQSALCLSVAVLRHGHAAARVHGRDGQRVECGADVLCTDMFAPTGSSVAEPNLSTQMASSLVEFVF
jgi:hypothetical protein